MYIIYVCMYIIYVCMYVCMYVDVPRCLYLIQDLIVNRIAVVVVADHLIHYYYYYYRYNFIIIVIILLDPSHSYGHFPNSTRSEVDSVDTYG